MAISFRIKNDCILLIYSTEVPVWVVEKLKSEGAVTLKKTFHFRRETLTHDIPSDANIDDVDEYTFQFANLIQDYWEIDKSILDTKFSVCVYKDIFVQKIEHAGINTQLMPNLSIVKFFVAETNISVFKKIDQICNEQIFIGGDHNGAIPAECFYSLIRHFPTTSELHRYANSRISNVIKDFVPTMNDEEEKLQKYFKKKKKRLSSLPLPQETFAFPKELYETELAKYTEIHRILKNQLLNNINADEKEWQKFLEKFLLLIYPQYVATLKEVAIPEGYSSQHKITNRFIDFMLVDQNGFIDIIEIKKPFENGILSGRLYRDNFYPKSELAGTLVQAEKYLFYLNNMSTHKIGKLTEKYKEKLPDGLKLKIRNPKARIILGRSNNFNDQQKSDFEIIKRQYSRIADISSYDDLLSNLSNVINSFEQKVS